MRVRSNRIYRFSQRRFVRRFLVRLPIPPNFEELSTQNERRIVDALFTPLGDGG